MKRPAGIRPALLIILITVLTASCSESKKTAADNKSSIVQNTSDYKVTFIELGSVNCVPCRMMQPVMDNVREKYGDQVNVVFYDVWTEKDKHYAHEYGIRAIPTQVFLDSSGKEYFRHEGFFPEEELVKVLREMGVR